MPSACLIVSKGTSTGLYASLELVATMGTKCSKALSIPVLSEVRLMIRLCEVKKVFLTHSSSSTTLSISSSIFLSSSQSQWKKVRPLLISRHL